MSLQLLLARCLCKRWLAQHITFRARYGLNAGTVCH